MLDDDKESLEEANAGKYGESAQFWTGYIE